MIKIGAEWRKYLLGSILVCSLLLGGSAASGMWTDALLQTLTILVAAPILSASAGEPIDRKVLAYCASILAAILIQLIPLPAGLLDLVRSEAFSQGRTEAGAGFDLITLGVGRTVDNLTYASALVFLMLAISRLPGEQVHALLPFLIAGIACQALAGAIQYAGTDRVSIEGVLPYTITAGTFANRNHFVSLLYVAIPFLVYVGTFRGMRLWSLLGMLVVLLVLLAAGSRAGAAIGLAAIILSGVFINARSRFSVAGIGLLVATLGIFGFGAWAQFEQRNSAMEDDARWDFAHGTMNGIWENWLFGVGYGNFSRAYQLFEDPASLGRAYANHAHNDYLELAFEGGLPAIVLVIAYVVLVSVQVLRIRHNQFQKAAFLGILFILLHSTVDYPLRTAAVGATFVFLNAVLFHRALQPRPDSATRYVKIKHGKRRIAVAVEPSA
ncbi:O-antigen ligase family protein [Mesorhizobium australicum]|uniref:O-antigen ligase n=1 Tax=Mesorhizobium australicum TaxID=536018 RepID=A0A1X7NRT5_9HYPH|nr:O-antigen ligase family protein [Mesorhizobium australicum]SMH40808.1 O-antigen ligase [Mesorhizobium australicum]